jgi:uncharacterized protein (TIGR03435 family)
MRTLLALFVCTAAAGLAAQEEPRIEAVSIKRNTSGASGGDFGARPGGYAAVNVPIHLLIGLAYPVQGSEIEGAPDWFYDEGYDLTARISGAPTPEQSRPLWRTVFAERMRLQAHMETREQPIYALVPTRADGRLSPNLKRVDTDCAAPGAVAQCTMMGRSTLTSRGMSMAALARLIQPTTGRIVVDRTGLSGFYELSLTFSLTRPGAPVNPVRGGEEPPSIFTAVKEQLGLELESARGPVDVLVIERIERPTED